MIHLIAKPVAQSVFDSIKLEMKKHTNLKLPKLSVILIGNDPASEVYVRSKERAAIELGFESELIRFSDSVSKEELQKKISDLNEDVRVSGILIQRPLPKHISEQDAVFWVRPSKDVDAFHPENIGKLSLGLSCLRSCTPLGIMELLQHYGISVLGKTVCIVGRSNIVGKPLAQLFLNKDATVIQCHSKTKALQSMTLASEIVIAALGRRHFLNIGHFQKNAIVIDVGIHREADHTLSGDVDPKGLDGHLSALSPVPGGVGPMTVALLMKNTLQAALYQQGLNHG